MRTDFNLDQLCEMLRQTYGDFHKSCRMVGLSTDFVTKWMKDDNIARERITEARHLGYMGLESVAINRAVVGVEKKLMYKGEEVGTEFVPSDTLLVKLMEAKLPEFKKGDQGGNTFNGPTQINIMPRANNFEEWLQMKDQQKARDDAAKELPALEGDYKLLTSEPINPMKCLEGLL